MPTKKPRDKFSAALVEPIRETSAETYALIASTESETERNELLQSEVKRVSRAITEKLRLLLSHYKIDPNKSDVYLQLALKLSLDFVPGFRVTDKKHPKRGRPRKWKGNDGDGEALFTALNIIASDRSISIASAAKVLQKEDARFEKYSSASIVARYYEAIKRRTSPARFIEMAEALENIAKSVEND